MARITIKAASYAARKMADVVFNEKIDSAENRLKGYADFLYELKVPKDIRKVATINLQFLDMDNSIEFVKIGGERLYTYTTTQHVRLSKIAVNDLEFKRLKKLKDEVLELQKARSNYLSSVVKYLLELYTTKRVKEEFPEALEYLGEPSEETENGAYEELRSKIRNAKNEE